MNVASISEEGRGAQGCRTMEMPELTKFAPVTDYSSSTLKSPTFQPQQASLEVVWHNLTYVVPRTGSRSLGRRLCPSGFGSRAGGSGGTGSRNERLHVILNSLNGQFKSGELTAVMGPSGSGKTTLLECLAGKRQIGVTGEITFSGTKRVKLSFIGQNDQLLCHMTVRESLLFASKLKNFKAALAQPTDENENQLVSLAVVPNEKIKSNELVTSTAVALPLLVDHEAIVDRLLDQFGLTMCAEVRVSNISGGQLKRLSIAQELVSMPNLLILDEPTSGLDSASCFQCVELLQQLAKAPSFGQPLAIVATIHQPSARVFNMFERVYFLSTKGQCIYDGPPTTLISHLSSIGLNCPPFNNPADYMTEIASEVYGSEFVGKLSILAAKKHKAYELTPADGEPTDMSALEKRLRPQVPYPFFEHIRLLFHRTFLSIARDPHLTTLRLLSHVMVGIFIGLLYGGKIGRASGCPPVFTMDSIGSTQKHLYDDIVTTSENVANLFFCAMFVMYGALMPTVLTFPMELHVFLKERHNGWYSCKTYYLAKTLADIPLQIVFPMIYGAIVYLMNGQIWSPWRFSMFLLTFVLIALVAQSQGLLISALYMDDPSSAVFVAPMSSIPFLLFGGFFVRIKTMPSYLVALSYVSYVRYAFEALISLMYGFERCVENPLDLKSDGTQSALFKFLQVFFTTDDYDYDSPENGTALATEEPASKRLIESIVKDFQENNPFISDVFADKNSTQSYVLKQFDLTDYSLYVNLARLTICFVVLRVLCYFILRWKTERKK